jgi:uncharacterized protein YbbC (DUF1343 family)
MITVGIERIEHYRPLLDGKRIGLITNPTGIDRHFVSTIDRLAASFHLVALFSPEHGVRGDLQAGVRLDDYVDPATGCTVYSLYGPTKQPTPAMMDAIDVLCFDIQDVGARFYTYLYTMAYALKACALADKPLVVFDRPNPVGATQVEGNRLDDRFASFVGNYGLPQRYGLTIGEVARYINEEADIHATLHVIPMEGYRRDMTYRDTGFPWVFPSPNIPSMDTPLLYLATCVFEGTTMSEGRGTTRPFEVVGSPTLDAVTLVRKMTERNLPGVAFRPLYFTPTFSKHQGTLCQGIQLHVTDAAVFRPVYTGMVLLKTIEALDPAFAYLPPYKEGLRPMIDLLNGDDFLREDRLDLSGIQTRLTQDAEAFRVIARRYHIYDDNGS